MLVTLSTRQLVYTYSLLLASGVLLVSYNLNGKFVKSQVELSQQSSPPSSTSSILLPVPLPVLWLNFRHNPWLIFQRSPHLFLSTVMVQCTLAFCFNSLKDELTRNFLQPTRLKLLQPLQVSSYVFFLSPVMLALLSVPEPYLQHLPFFTTFLAGLEFHMALLVNFHNLADFFQIAWAKSNIIVHTFGIQVFVELQWKRLHVPLVLRLFWLSRAAYHMGYFSTQRVFQNSENAEKTLSSYYLGYDEIVAMTKEILILGSDTHISLLGMTSCISLLGQCVGEFCILLVGSSREEDHYMGVMSAILFFILALQTGLSGLVPVKRLGRLYCNASLLMMAMLHFIHGMVHPELLTISAGRNTSVKRHARTLCICSFLISFTLTMIIYLWNNNPISTWLFAVVAFGIELVFKVLISLIIYSLFMIDAQMENFWEGLDDYIYYVKSTGHTVEFLFGLFLFANGAWILVFESGGTIRALMMCVHAYFNIWTQAKEGWEVFMKRRLAVTKISQLPIATTSELDEYADVCAICYSRLNSARVTKCHHMFHGVCLRKWLYIQDQCPLCQQVIYSSEQSS